MFVLICDDLNEYYCVIAVSLVFVGLASGAFVLIVVFGVVLLRIIAVLQCWCCFVWL